MDQICIITTSSHLICLKNNLEKTVFWTPLSSKYLSKTEPLLLRVRHEGIFALCPGAITIYVTIQHNIFSK